MDDQGLMRVSDADRDAAATDLRTYLLEGYLTIEEFTDRVTLAYGARTRHDLTEVVVGLPALPNAVAPALYEDPAPAPLARPRDPDAKNTWSIGFFSGFTRKGRWRIGPLHRVLCLFGGGKLDLREAEFAADHTYIDCLALFGGMDVVVSEDIDVDMTGFAIFGGRSVKTSEVPPRGAPRVTVRAIAIFGGVDVKQKPLERSRSRRRRRDRA